LRVLVTGWSGQIGTNLALRLLADGNAVLGVDEQLNTWTDSFRSLLQDLSEHDPAILAASAACSASIGRRIRRTAR
jgi:nucleoside-diphosphate-sugar epimerase